MKLNTSFCFFFFFVAFKLNAKEVDTSLLFKTNYYGFIENKGQIKDQFNHLNLAVKYVFNSNGLNVQLRSNGFSYDSYFIETTSETKNKTQIVLPSKFETSTKKVIYHFHRIDIEFINSNFKQTDSNFYPKLIAELPSTYYINYYTTQMPEEGVLQVKTYKKVTYKNIYNGIDLEFLLDENYKPKYNFIVHPGADASQIKWKYNGASNTSLQNGKIRLALKYSNLEEIIPVSFFEETSQSLEVSYRIIDENEFGFSVPSYNKNYTLVIDPTPNLLWATYFGGNGNDEGNDLALDSLGNVYVTGGTTSVTAISTSGAFQSVYEGSIDAFLIKYNSNGILQWGTYFGASGEDVGVGISLDHNGNIVVAGKTVSTDSIATTGVFQTTFGGSLGSYGDGFISKFNNLGFRQWCTYYGGSGADQINEVSIDRLNNILITGSTTSANNIATIGSQQPNAGGNWDAFVAKFSNNGNRIWGTYYGGNDQDFAFGISSDSLNNIYMAGQALSANGISSTGAYQTIYNGESDAIVVKFNSTGVLQWATYFGGDDYDNATAIATTASGTVFITGYTYSNNDIATVGATQTINKGNSDAFLAKFTNYGALQWGTYYGDTSSDAGSSITLDALENCFIVGKTQSNKSIADSGAFQSNRSDSNDVFITKFNSNGIKQWGTYYGGAGNENCNSINTIGNTGSIYISGSTSSTNLITSASTLQYIYGGGNSDAFIAKFDLGCPFTPIVKVIGNASFCFGDGVSFQTKSGLWDSYQWNKNGTPIQGANDTFYTTKTFGQYKLHTSKTDGCSDSSLVINVTINPNPKAGFTINDSSQCITRNSFIFNDTSTITSGVLKRNWILSTGDTSSQVSLAVSLTTANTYLVKLISTSLVGCKDSLVKNIIVYPKPNVGFSQNNFAQCLIGNNFSLNDTSFISSGTISRLWNLGDLTTSSVSSLIKQFSNDGIYSIKLIERSNHNCIDSIEKTIIVYPQPKVGFTQNSIAQCLSDNHFVFNDTSTISSGSLSTVWKFGDATNSILTNVNKSYIKEGTYQIKLVAVSNNNCEDSISKMVTVYPQTKIGFLVNNFNQCLVGNNFLFTDSSTISSGTYSRLWSMDNNSSFLDTSYRISKNLLQSGKYSINLKAITNKGCLDSVQQSINVYENPTAQFIADPARQCFNGNKVHFVNESVTVNPPFILKYLWDFGDGTTDTAENSYKSFNASGIYTVVMKVWNAQNCMDSDIHQIQIDKNPGKPTIISVTNSKIKSSFSTNNYLWYVNNKTIENSNLQSIFLHQNGYYFVKVDSANGCSNRSDSLLVTLFSNSQIRIFPNPNNGYFTIDFIDLSGEKQIGIYDMQGKLLNEYTTTENSVDITSVFSNGMYLLKLQSESKMYVVKVIVQ